MRQETISCQKPNKKSVNKTAVFKESKIAYLYILPVFIVLV